MTATSRLFVVITLFSGFCLRVPQGWFFSRRLRITASLTYTLFTYDERAIVNKGDTI